jgi:hypothetical protein
MEAFCSEVDIGELLSVAHDKVSWLRRFVDPNQTALSLREI